MSHWCWEKEQSGNLLLIYQTYRAKLTFVNSDAFMPSVCRIFFLPIPKYIKAVELKLIMHCIMFSYPKNLTPSQFCVNYFSSFCLLLYYFLLVL